jgi:hypothetical protein
MKQRTRDVWVHVNCEGWVTLGPFEWVAMIVEVDALVDERGTTIAAHDGDRWRVPGSDVDFRTPIITTSREHRPRCEDCCRSWRKGR